MAAEDPLDLTPLKPEVSLPSNAAFETSLKMPRDAQDIPNPDSPEFAAYLDGHFAMGVKLIDSMP